MKRSRLGLTILELLIAVGILGIVLAVAWLGFLGTFRRIRTIGSLSAAIEASVVILERVTRDVDQIVMSPPMGEKPMVIATGGTAISFYVPTPARRDDPEAVVAVPVVYHLIPAEHGLFRPARNGRPLGPVLVSSWHFSYVVEGGIRRAEGVARLDLSGFTGSQWQGRGESARPSAVSTDDARVFEAPPLESADPTLPATAPLAHAGPFLLLKFTVVDDGGAAVSRVVLYDLVNAHMAGDHGKEFPLPTWGYRFEGDLPRFQRDLVRGIDIPAPMAAGESPRIVQVGRVTPDGGP